MIVPAMMLAQAAIASTPALGTVEGRCRPGQSGPALLVDVTGLKDRAGVLRAEIYPERDGDFLADDNTLVSQGKVFRRVVAALPSSGPVQLCIRVPAAGTYALAVVHARTGKRGFSLLKDGIGFGANPRLGYAKPKAASAAVVVRAVPTPTTVIMNYRSGLFSFGPLRR
ncbi:DUF2141 domain-containing protein [Sphingomonas sp.]|uniref:DUF2141 domain-containing protein n=1 Tax=Sphingomonas sp. TaxID=28214 RepID=UPI0035BC9589